MILYADASALVKRYVNEEGSAEVVSLTGGADAVATAVISRVEVSAALARSVRQGVLDETAGRRAQRRFAGEWPDLVRIPVTEGLAGRAESLAWDHNLRGYDALQLAAALTWQSAVNVDVTLATFDRQLWDAAVAAGVHVWPVNLRTPRR